MCIVTFVAIQDIAYGYFGHFVVLQLHLLNEEKELARIANMDNKHWIYFTISANAILITLVIFTFFFKMTFNCFSCGRNNTNPGYTSQEIEDEIF